MNVAEEAGGLVIDPMHQFQIHPLFGEGPLTWYTPTNQTLWLGIKLARKRGDGLQVTALSASLRSRFAPSPELSLLDKGVFDD